MSKGGVKFDEGKPRMDLIPPEGLFEIAKVFTYGADKYDDWNWCKGLRWGRTVAASLRHIFQWIGGEDDDKETGLSHLAHAGCCMMMLISMIERGAGDDDRYKESNEA